MLSTNVHPRTLDLLEITREYPLTDELTPARGSLWFRLKQMLGQANLPAEPHPSLRAAWFTAYEELNKGFVIFEGTEIKRIILVESEHDAKDLARCRELLVMLNDVHGVLRRIDDEDSVAFHKRFLTEARSVCRQEPMSRRPLFFIQDVNTADARLNSMFYQAICHACECVQKTWEHRDADVEAQLYDHQDRVIQLWQDRASQPDLLAWRDLLKEALAFLKLAFAAATTDTRPEIVGQKSAPISDVSLPRDNIDEEEDVPNLDQLLAELQ